jgi:hypothetical protein
MLKQRRTAFQNHHLHQLGYLLVNGKRQRATHTIDGEDHQKNDPKRESTSKTTKRILQNSFLMTLILRNIP